MRSLAPMLAVAFVAIPLLSAAQNSVSEEHNGLLHELETDAAMYWMHDLVGVSYSVTNVSPDSIVLLFPCEPNELFTRYFDPMLEPIWDLPMGCSDVMWVDTLYSGEGYTLDVSWDMMTYETWDLIEEPGTYTVMGYLSTNFSEYEHWVSVTIEILDPAAGVDEELDTTWAAIKSLFR